MADDFTVSQIQRFTISLEAVKKDHPQVVAAIQYAQKLIQSRPFESGFVIGKDGWRYFTTESVPSFIVFYYVDEVKKAIWLMKIEVLEESE